MERAIPRHTNMVFGHHFEDAWDLVNHPSLSIALAFYGNVYESFQLQTKLSEMFGQITEVGSSATQIVDGNSFRIRIVVTNKYEGGYHVKMQRIYKEAEEIIEQAETNTQQNVEEAIGIVNELNPYREDDIVTVTIQKSQRDQANPLMVDLMAGAVDAGYDISKYGGEVLQNAIQELQKKPLDAVTMTLVYNLFRNAVDKTVFMGFDSLPSQVDALKKFIPGFYENNADSDEYELIDTTTNYNLQEQFFNNEDTRRTKGLSKEEQDFVEHFNHEPTNFEDVADRDFLEQFSDNLEKMVFRGIDYISGGRDSKIDDAVASYALLHKDIIEKMTPEDFHNFITHNSRNDYDKDGQLTEFDRLVWERLVQRMKRYRDKHGQVVMSVDQNPISDIQLATSEMVYDLVDTYLTERQALDVHDYISHIQTTGVLGQDTAFEKVKAAVVLSLTTVLENIASAVRFANYPIISLQNIVKGRPVIEGISAEQAVNDALNSFSLLGLVWVGQYAKYLQSQQGNLAAAQFLAMHFGKQEVSKQAGRAAEKFAIQYDIAGQLGPGVERAIGMAIAYQVLDGIPFIDNVSNLALSGLSGMLLSNFIVRNSGSIIRHTASNLSLRALKFVSPEPLLMRSYFTQLQTLQMYREIGNLAMDVMDIPRPLDNPVAFRDVIGQRANILSESQFNNDRWLVRGDDPAHQRLEERLARRRGHLNDQFLREVFIPRANAPARVVQRAQQAHGNVNYEIALPGFMEEIQNVAAHNNALAQQAIQILERGGIGGRYAPYIIHLITGIVTAAGAIKISYNRAESAVVDKSKQVKSFSKDLYKTVTDFSLNSILSPDKIVQMANGVVGDGEKSFGQMSIDLWSEIKQQIPQDTTLRFGNTILNDIDSKTALQVGGTILGVVGTTYAMDQVIKTLGTTSSKPLPEKDIKHQQTAHGQQKQIIFPPKTEKLLKQTFEKTIQAPSSQIIFNSTPQARESRHRFQQQQYNSFKNKVMQASRQNRFKQARTSVLGKRFSRGYIYDED